MQANLPIGLEPFPLLELIDDCLIAVFTKLPSVDLVNVSQVCQRFNKCARYAFLHDNSCIHLTSPYTSEEVQIVVETFGPITKNIVINMKFFPEWFSVFSPLIHIRKNCDQLSSVKVVNADFHFITGASDLPVTKHLIIENITMCRGLYYLNSWLRHSESITLINVRVSLNVLNYIQSHFQQKYLKSKQVEIIEGRKLSNIIIEKAIFMFSS